MKRTPIAVAKCNFGDMASSMYMYMHCSKLNLHAGAGIINYMASLICGVVWLLEVQYVTYFMIHIEV